jgi:hypothetical protein
MEVYYAAPSRLPLPPSSDCWLLAIDVGIDGASGFPCLPLPTLAFAPAPPGAVPEPEEGGGGRTRGRLWRRGA